LGRDEERRVASWYNSLSGSYDELYSEEQSSKHDLVLGFLRGNRFKILVDIGAGTGTFLRRARNRYDWGVGIDVSQKMLRLAKKEKADNVELILASSTKLPIRGGSIDCAVSISTAKADDKLQEFVGEMERIGSKKSMRIATILESSDELSPRSVSNPSFRTRLSNRETLYVLSPHSSS
jgi:ubiquinone/menaquinone biosynthesis C-methylase UbiE